MVRAMLMMLCSVASATVNTEENDGLLQAKTVVKSNFTAMASSKEESIADRCLWSELKMDKYIGGCSAGCRGFKGEDSVELAKVACEQEPTCGGVTWEYDQWELRSGPTVADTPKGKGENSLVCIQSRCVWSEIKLEKYIGGCSAGCRGFKGEESLEIAKAACDQEPTCGGVTWENDQWELRSGPYLGDTPTGKGEQSFACLPKRCHWSVVKMNKYIGGCSAGCKGYKGLESLELAKAGCDQEPSCGGVTWEYDQWEFRSGPYLGDTPTGKGENSYVCQPL